MGKRVGRLRYWPLTVTGCTIPSDPMTLRRSASKHSKAAFTHHSPASISQEWATSLGKNQDATEQQLLRARGQYGRSLFVFITVASDEIILPKAYPTCLGALSMQADELSDRPVQEASPAHPRSGKQARNPYFRRA